MAIIHARSAADPNIPAAFANDATFEAIRIEPYLRATGRAHPELASRFDELAADDAHDEARAGPRRHQSEEHPPRPEPDRCSSTPNAPGSAIPLSISPSVSIISCLRARARAPTGARYNAAFSALANAYLAGVDWESADGLEARAAALLPALFLARVDGKSPVEYLTRESERAAVRRCAAPLIADPPRRLMDVADAWSRAR